MKTPGDLTEIEAYAVLYHAGTKLQAAKRHNAWAAAWCLLSVAVHIGLWVWL